MIRKLLLAVTTAVLVPMAAISAGVTVPTTYMGVVGYPGGVSSLVIRVPVSGLSLLECQRNAIDELSKHRFAFIVHECAGG